MVRRQKKGRRQKERQAEHQVLLLVRVAVKCDILGLGVVSFDLWLLFRVRVNLLDDLSRKLIVL